MDHSPAPLKFFLGANTPQGFFSFFRELTEKYKEDYTLYPIKGGPGTGKSTLMKKATLNAIKSEPFGELIYCSSDPDSLDAVLLPKRKIIIVDATPPHTIEPAYPGAFERPVCLYSAFDYDALAQKREILYPLVAQNQSCHTACARLMAAAQGLFYDNYLTFLAASDVEKMVKTAKNLAIKELRRKKAEGPGEEHCRFLNAVTPKGFYGFYENLKACPRIVAIDDPFGAASSIMMQVLRKELLKRGFSIYSCFSPFDPENKIDHILVPEIGLAFVTQNRLLAVPKEKISKTLHYTRFLISDTPKRKKQRIRFNQRVAFELINEAIRVSKRGKELHDDIEAVYHDAVNFKIVEQITKATQKAINIAKID